MDTFKKACNVFGIIIAWILSIVLVITLIISPMMLSALSLLKAETITKAVTGALTQSLAPSDDDKSAGDYSVAKLSSVSEEADDGNANAAGDVLQSVFGDQISPELMDKILSSKTVNAFIGTYMDDVANAFVGDEKDAKFNEEKLKKIAKDNIDELVDIAREIDPSLGETDTEKLKDTILSLVDENAQQIIEALPKPAEIRQEVMNSNPELEKAFAIFARKDAIKAAIVGVIVLLSALIFLCRLCGFRGLRWLAVDLFVGGGFNLLTCVGLLLGKSMVLGMMAEQLQTAALISSLLSSFTTGVLVRTLVMLVAGGALLTAYIFIRKVQKMDKYDIIVLAGQSNAEGQGLGEVTKEFVPDERIHIMKDDTNFKFVTKDGVSTLTYKWPAVSNITVADEREHPRGKMGCFALQFAEKYVKEYLEEGRKILILNANFGGTGFARPEWGVGNIMHERMISMTKEALSLNKKNRVVALLWAQGEHDSFENADWDPEKRYTTHKANLTATFNDFYEKLGDKSVPVIACGFPDTFCESAPEATDAVLKAIKEVVADFGGGFVETKGLLSNAQKLNNNDIYHYCKESLHILGGKLFEKYTELRKAVCPNK